jgi:hypothetical protein
MRGVCKILHVTTIRDDEGRGHTVAVLERPDGSVVAADYGGERVELRGARRPVGRRRAVPMLGVGIVPTNAPPS